MMEAVAIPPFERFYEAHREEILAFLVRRLGRDRAEDAFQETFLRALRAYGRLAHGEHLRAWAYTIASRVALDELRRRRPAARVGAGADADAAVDELPAYAQLEHLASDLPPTERAAVVLRYGYDLEYAEIGAALGSNAEAARQAASSGVRRLRRNRKELP
jgi:RNA polymerase sigma factor (sigma-70 family)